MINLTIVYGMRAKIKKCYESIHVCMYVEILKTFKKNYDAEHALFIFMFALKHSFL